MTIANLTLSQHPLEKKKKEIMHFISPTRPHLEGELNDRKVNRSKIKQKWVKKREF